MCGTGDDEGPEECSESREMGHPESRRERWKLRPEGNAGVGRQLGSRWLLVEENSIIDRGGKQFIKLEVRKQGPLEVR